MASETITGTHLRVTDPSFFRTARFHAILAEYGNGVVEIEYYQQSGVSCGWGRTVAAVLLTPGSRSTFDQKGDVANYEGGGGDYPVDLED